MGKYMDLAGQRFGRLTVVEYVGRTRHGHVVWKCACECGGSSTPTTQSLRCGHARSCGCIASEKASKMGRAKRTHGMSKSREYAAWARAIGRCSREDDKAYRYYGGRGIRVCDEWQDSFEAFFAHIGPRPSSAHTLDRIDVNGNYEPGNVKWSTITEQLRNTTKTFWVDFRGKRMSLAEVAEVTGVPYPRIKNRLLAGWPVDDAVFRPPWYRYKK